jgi:hypothetical protein
MTVSDTKMKIFLEFGVEGYGGTRRLTALGSKSKELRRLNSNSTGYGDWIQKRTKRAGRRQAPGAGNKPLTI